MPQPTPPERREPKPTPDRPDRTPRPDQDLPGRGPQPDQELPEPEAPETPTPKR